MMKGSGRPQWLLLLAAVAATVLLAMAPRSPRGVDAAPVVDLASTRLAEAVALVNGAEPMQGIMLLREIVAEDTPASFASSLEVMRFLLMPVPTRPDPFRSSSSGGTVYPLLRNSGRKTAAQFCWNCLSRRSGRALTPPLPIP